jgi:hypothetical protein
MFTRSKAEGLTDDEKAQALSTACDPELDREPIPRFAYKPLTDGPWGCRRFDRPLRIPPGPFDPVPEWFAAYEKAMLIIPDRTDKDYPLDIEDFLYDESYWPEGQEPPDLLQATRHLPGKRPALSLAELKTRHLSEQHTAIVKQWFERPETSNYHAQIAAIARELRDCKPALSWRGIGEIFGVSGSTAQSHASEGGWTGESVERPSILMPSHLAILSEFIRDRFDAKQPASLVDISDYLLEPLGHALRVDRIRHITLRLPGFKLIDGVPFEAARVHADSEEIEAYLNDMTQLIEDCPAAMIVNLDETGHCDWVDARREKVVVPEGFPADEIQVPVERASKRSSLLGAITADGGYLKPLVIVERDTLETELFDLG